MTSHVDDGAAKLVLTDRDSEVVPIDLPMDTLFPPGRKLERNVESIKKNLLTFDAAATLEKKYGALDISQAISHATENVFRLPAVGSKMFLISIADRVSIVIFATQKKDSLLTVADCWWFDCPRSACWPVADTCCRCGCYSDLICYR